MKRLVVHLYKVSEEMSYSSLETKSDVENRLAKNVQRHAKLRKYNELEHSNAKKRRKITYLKEQ